MRPDAQASMLGAITFGPAYCPPGLLDGPVDRVLLGLKAHANTISHARHVALEQSFPRTREELGADDFHEAAARYLESADALSLPLRHIGRTFPDRLTGKGRDLARLEWAWLEAHGAAEREPFDLHAVAKIDASTLVAVQVTRHPAARVVQVTQADLQFDGAAVPHDHVLITRPYADVAVTSVPTAIVRLFEMIDRPRIVADLLDIDPDATTALISHGALSLSPEKTS